MGLLCGCHNDDERRQAVAAERAAELLRITDPAHGADQLRHQILQNLKRDGAYVAVRIYGSEVQVIPASTPWTVRCDEYAGISITFTANVTDPSGGLIIQLSEARPRFEQCVKVALATAQLLDAVLAGR